MLLWHDWLTNKDKTIWKWTHYLPIYERHFARFIGKSFVFLEIGVWNGGSLQMWKRYFGPFVTVVGIDINPSCKKLEENQIHVRIGDQSDPKFLQGVIDEFGAPSIILDDGSHIQKHVNASWDYLYDKMDANGVYMVEDLGCAYYDSYGGGLKREGTFIERSKALIDELRTPSSNFGNTIDSISVYNSIVAFEKRRNTLQQNDTYPPPRISAI